MNSVPVIHMPILPPPSSEHLHYSLCLGHFSQRSPWLALLPLLSLCSSVTLSVLPALTTLLNLQSPLGPALLRPFPCVTFCHCIYCLQTCLLTYCLFPLKDKLYESRFFIHFVHWLRPVFHKDSINICCLKVFET